MVDKIATVLQNRDGLSEKEAKEAVRRAREEIMERIGNGEMPFDFCEEAFGLEPDYLDELIF